MKCKEKHWNVPYVSTAEDELISDVASPLRRSFATQFRRLFTYAWSNDVLPSPFRKFDYIVTPYTG